MAKILLQLNCKSTAAPGVFPVPERLDGGRVSRYPEGLVHTLQIRAIDGAGRVRTAKRSGEWPAGATGYHALTVEVL